MSKKIRNIQMVKAIIALMLMIVPACAESLPDAQARAEAVLQQRLDLINADLYTKGLPMITMDQLKAERQRSIDLQQKMKADVIKDNGGCAQGFKPANEGGNFYEGGCVPRTCPSGEYLVAGTNLCKSSCDAGKHPGPNGYGCYSN
jgi:hypothetical protein